MRIGMIAPLEMRVPPVGYGGTELVVSLLTEELVRRGHDVTLFASGDSVTEAHLVPGSDRFLRGSDRDKGILTMLNVTACLERAEAFDLIHNHTCFEGMATAGLVGTPVLTTLHGGLAGDWCSLFERYHGWYNTISQSAKMLLPDKPRFAGVVYNAIDCSSYPLNPRRRDESQPLVYLSRISREKGTHLAIEIARRLGQPLLVAGNVDDVDRTYFETEVAPWVDGKLITYLGEADAAAKRKLLHDARCLLAPNSWDEPFGLFMVEAMACGTPVVVGRRGSADEVVASGATGFVVDSLDAMAEAVSRVGEIDPAACRRWVEDRFDVSHMVDGYLAVYERILEASSRAARPGRPPGPSLHDHDLDIALAAHDLEPDVLRVPVEIEIEESVPDR